jgi:sortase B
MKYVNQEKISVKEWLLSRIKKHSKKYYIMEGIRKVIMLVALCVFTYSAYELTNIYLDYKEGDDAYDNMEEMFEIPNISDSEDNNDVTGNKINNSNDEAVWKYDYQALLNMNSDAVGWIKQDNIISYPIVRGTDNTYYLTHNAAHRENKAGAIFLDYRVNDGLEAKNCIIYGHDMLNDSMFGTLIKYGSKSYYDAHPTFDIYIADKGYKYYVFATYETTEIGDTYSYNFGSDEEFQQYIDLCMSKRLYETNAPEVNTGSKIITLSTCTRGDQSKRFIVQLVRGEQIT